MSLIREWRSVVAPLATMAIILTLWEFLPASGLVNELAFPRFSKVLAALLSFLNPSASAIEIPGGVTYQLSVTLYEIVVAFLLTVALGLTLGFAIGLFRFARDTYEPLIYLAYAFPGVAIYPLIVVVAGFGTSSKIIFGIFLGFFPMVLGVISALRSVKPSLITVARAFGASRWQLFSKVVTPGAAPAIFTGIRIAMGLNIVGVLFAEMTGSQAGLGWMISLATFQLEVPSQYAAVLLAVLVAGGITWSLRLVERRVSNYA